MQRSHRGLLFPNNSNQNSVLNKLLKLNSKDLNFLLKDKLCFYFNNDKHKEKCIDLFDYILALKKRESKLMDLLNKKQDLEGKYIDGGHEYFFDMSEDKVSQRKSEIESIKSEIARINLELDKDGLRAKAVGLIQDLQIESRMCSFNFEEIITSYLNSEETDFKPSIADRNSMLKWCLEEVNTFFTKMQSVDMQNPQNNDLWKIQGLIALSCNIYKALSRIIIENENSIRSLIDLESQNNTSDIDLLRQKALNGNLLKCLEILRPVTLFEKISKSDIQDILKACNDFQMTLFRLKGFVFDGMLSDLKGMDAIRKYLGNLAEFSKSLVGNGAVDSNNDLVNFSTLKNQAKESRALRKREFDKLDGDEVGLKLKILGLKVIDCFTGVLQFNKLNEDGDLLDRENIVRGINELIKEMKLEIDAIREMSPERNNDVCLEMDNFLNNFHNFLNDQNGLFNMILNPEKIESRDSLNSLRSNHYFKFFKIIDDIMDIFLGLEENVGESYCVMIGSGFCRLKYIAEVREQHNKMAKDEITDEEECSHVSSCYNTVSQIGHIVRELEASFPEFSFKYASKRRTGKGFTPLFTELDDGKSALGKKVHNKPKAVSRKGAFSRYEVGDSYSESAHPEDEYHYFRDCEVDQLRDEKASLYELSNPTDGITFATKDVLDSQDDNNLFKGLSVSERDNSLPFEEVDRSSLDSFNAMKPQSTRGYRPSFFERLRCTSLNQVEPTCVSRNEFGKTLDERSEYKGDLGYFGTNDTHLDHSAILGKDPASKDKSFSSKQTKGSKSKQKSSNKIVPI